jgi:hypothetical protein
MLLGLLCFWCSSAGWLYFLWLDFVLVIACSGVVLLVVSILGGWVLVSKLLPVLLLVWLGC